MKTNSFSYRLCLKKLCLKWPERNWLRNSENTKKRWIKPFQMGLNFRSSEPLLWFPFVLLSPSVHTPAISLSSSTLGLASTSPSAWAVLSSQLSRTCHPAYLILNLVFSYSPLNHSLFYDLLYFLHWVCFWSYDFFLTFSVAPEGEQNMPPQILLLWHIILN